VPAGWDDPRLANDNGSGAGQAAACVSAPQILMLPLNRQIEEIAATTAPCGRAHSHDTGRNRDESRTVTVFDPSNKLDTTDWRPNVAAIIRVQRDVFIRNSKTGLLRHTVSLRCEPPCL
jgi:hypothetical protein